MENKNLLILIIVAVIILGFVYYSSVMPNKDQMENEILSDDTSVETLEQELTDTDLDNMDQEFADIEMELEAAISESR